MSMIENIATSRVETFPNLVATPGRPIARAKLTNELAASGRQNKILAQLSAVDLAHLQHRFQVVNFERGQTVFPSDHEIDALYFPTTAVASRLTVLEDGSTVEVGLIGCDGVIGLSAFMGNGRTRNWTVADIAGSAFRLRIGVLREGLPSFPTLARAMSIYYQDYFAQVTRRAVCRSRHTIVQQLCSWLLMVRDRTNTASLPLTQESIARRLGSRRAGITVAANSLKQAGAISYYRGHITIADRALLENLACECYGALNERLEFGGHWNHPARPTLRSLGAPTAA